MITITQARAVAKPFALGSAAFAAFALYKAVSIPLVQSVGAVLVIAPALFPMFLWCTGRGGHGLPVFPTFALMFLSTAALPLLSNHAALVKYTEVEQLLAAASVGAFLAAGTATWYSVARRPTRPPVRYRGFGDVRRSPMPFLCLGFGCLFHTPFWYTVYPNMPGGAYTILRMTSGSLAMLAICLLSFAWGCRQLSAPQRVVFAAMTFYFVMAEVSGLMIHAAASTLVITCLMYCLGRGRIPIAYPAVAVAVLALLHLGKWPMRAEYWQGSASVRTSEGYIEFYTKWLGYGVSAALDDRVNGSADVSATSSVVDRVGVVHMVMLVEHLSPDVVPFLAGETYAIIPQLLVPRLLSEDKIRAHEGTYILAIAYGLQTRESVMMTTIGFGPVAEAYANFGVFGLLGVGAGFGAFFGWASRVSADVPANSYRAIWSMSCVVVAFQTESTLGVMVTSVFQATVVLTGLALLTMSVQTARPAARPRAGRTNPPLPSTDRRACQPF